MSVRVGALGEARRVGKAAARRTGRPDPTSAPSAILAPLLYAAGRGGKKLTDSGVYYLPFAFPFNVNGGRSFALHVADGSQIVIRRAGGPSVTVDVGPDGDERYGSCLARLGSLDARGRLPADSRHLVHRSAGVRYEQESFVGRALRVDLAELRPPARRRDRRSGVRRRRPSRPVAGRARARRQPTALDHGSTRLVWSGDGTSPTPRCRSTSRPARKGDVYAAVPSGPNDGRPLQVEQRTYDAARADVSNFWQAGSTKAPCSTCPTSACATPSARCSSSSCCSTWRYSAGNPTRSCRSQRRPTSRA